tara:strand:- start:4804 stop:5067 length:264 start_codon:yes stop_codon:yes gene_type:complete
MKDMGMSWKDIKSTPRYELEGLLRAYSTYNTIHAFDGHSEKDVNQLAKNNPSIREQYSKSMETKTKYEILMGITKQKQKKTFSSLFN